MLVEHVAEAALAARAAHLPDDDLSALVGTSFRRHRLWARVLLVAGALARGTDLTTAAADAGFASPSHLSDCVRRMFGLTATQLFAGRPTLVVAADGPPPVTPGRRPGGPRRC